MNIHVFTDSGRDPPRRASECTSSLEGKPRTVGTRLLNHVLKPLRSPHLAVLLSRAREEAANTFFSDEYWDRSLTAGDALRGRSAVHQAVLANGLRVWVICRYDEARAALADPRLSKAIDGLKAVIHDQLTRAGLDPSLSNMFSRHMLFEDDP